MNTCARFVGLLGITGVLLLGMASGARAEEKRLHLGARAGLHLRWVSSDPKVDGMTTTGGPNAGVMVNYGLSEKLGLQAGTYFIQKGFKSKETTQSQSTNGNTALNYVEVQALANWSPGGMFPRKFFFLAGPSLGLRTSAKQTTEVVNSAGSTTTKLDVSSFYKSTDLSLLGGLGVIV